MGVSCVGFLFDDFVLICTYRGWVLDCLVAS